MDRRQLIKQIAVITGSVVAGGELFLSGCKNSDKTLFGFFTEKDISFFDEVAETILPKTNTPGAKDAEVGKFMASYSAGCYDESQRKTLKDGISKLNEASEKMNRVSFMEATAPQRHTLLTSIDAESKKYNEERNQSKKEQPPHYFTLMKQLTLLGFFSSKPGVTQVFRYEPVPGKYEGCIDYKEGETSWA